MQRELFERQAHELAMSEHVCASDAFTYADFLESAESVLRHEMPGGPLACIVDARERRKLAADLMQRDSCGGVPYYWLVRFQELSAIPNQCVRNLGFLGDVDLVDGAIEVACRCGVEPMQHARTYDMDERFVPLCWHDYTESRAISDEMRRRRRQAVGNFPVAMFAAVWSAHSTGPELRTRAAWAVLDAVDGGHKIIASLARFLRIGRKSVKASARFHPVQPSEWVGYGKTRRILRALPAMPERFLAAGLISLDGARSWLPLVDLIARAARIEQALLFSAPADLFDDLDRLPACLDGRQKRNLLRSAIRLVRRDPSRGIPIVLSGVLFSPYLRPPPKPDPFPRIVVQLPSGWHAHSLVEFEEVEREGHQMGHCVGKFARQAMRGEVQIFSLYGSEGAGRATVVLRPPPGTCDECDEIEVEIAAMRNGPLSPAALIAVGELLGYFGGRSLQICLRSI